MANPFLVMGGDELETAILYGNAKITDIGNAVAYTDGKRVFVNTEDNLMKILPAYNEGMLKWLLWHEKYHMELRHHNRFFRYIDELKVEDLMDEFHVTKDEVNIIMDILVHDSLSKMFPDLVETAIRNLAQMRNRNSLGYTFTTYNLEDMLDEYAKYKHEEDKDGGDGTGKSEETEETKSKDGKGKGEGIGDTKSEDTKEDGKDKAGDGKTKDDKDRKGHSKGGSDRDGRKSTAEDGEPEEIDGATKPELEPEHDKTDWSKLDKIDSKEFIDEHEANRYEEAINRLKRKKLKMGRLTQQLNGLASTKRDRTYRLPSILQTGDGCIFKGKAAGRVELYLIFDASGSMSGEMKTFKEIITKSIPQALKCPCEWFAGHYDYDYTGKKLTPYKRDGHDGYYKGTFQDFLPIHATNGYDDDGDRVIELCYLAEQKGFSPIGVTDGGGRLSWSKDKLKQLKRTVLVGQNSYWLQRAKEINPNIQIMDIDIRQEGRVIVMYKIIKEAGHNKNVLVVNTETSSSIIIGRLSIEVLNLLEREGHKIENYSNEIDLEVNSDVAKELSSFALKMKKPIRDQSVKKPKAEDKPKVDANVDAFDLIFGRI